MDVDVVVVAYRSAAHVRGCVEQLCGADGIRVFVVDNACPDDSTSLVADLTVDIVPMGANHGFAAACNRATGLGDAPAVLFLNPDARMTADAVLQLAETFEADPACGAAGPRIVDDDGRLSLSVRRDPGMASALAEACFLHHAARRAAWCNEIVREGYDEPHDAEWLSGAALCVRRAAFERVGGFDERFFLYSEDADLCARLRDAGFRIRYCPGVEARHCGAGSAPSAGQAALRAAARIRYAQIHAGGGRYVVLRAAFALHELLRLPVALLRSPAHVRGRLSALASTLGRAPAVPPSRGGAGA